jgi:hypothetical protein
MTKTIFVTLVLFQVEVFKTIKVFGTIMKSIVANGLVVVARPLKKQEPPLRGYGLFYTCGPEQIWHSQLELCETPA